MRWTTADVNDNDRQNLFYVNLKMLFYKACLWESCRRLSYQLQIVLVTTNSCVQTAEKITLLVLWAAKSECN